MRLVENLGRDISRVDPGTCPACACGCQISHKSTVHRARVRWQLTRILWGFCLRHRWSSTELGVPGAKFASKHSSTGDIWRSYLIRRKPSRLSGCSLRVLGECDGDNGGGLDAADETEVGYS